MRVSGAIGPERLMPGHFPPEFLMPGSYEGNSMTGHITLT